MAKRRNISGRTLRKASPTNVTPVAWISDRNMGFSMGTSAVNFSFEDLMKLKTIINAN